MKVMVMRRRMVSPVQCSVDLTLRLAAHQKGTTRQQLLSRAFSFEGRGEGNYRR